MQQKTKIITVANRKGGAGKSTCAAHLALEATHQGLKVILIDLDPQKTLEQWWEKRKEENPYLAETTPSTLNDKIALIKNKGFDLCIIDTPGDVSANTLKGIEVADLIVIPTKPTSPDLRAIGRTIGLVKENNKEFLFVITQAIAQSTIALEAASVLSEFGSLAPSTIANRVAYANAMSGGNTASNLDKNASIELEQVWKFLSSKIWNKQLKTNAREKEKI